MSVKGNMSKLSSKVAAALALAIVLLAGILQAQAADTVSKTLLIINSYHEDELWANKMSQPIELLLAKNDTVNSEKVFLNNSSITDMESYQAICDNIFSTYADRHPSYVVLVGNFAFTLRDRIVEEWGDVPMLLISRIETYAPTDQYFLNVYDGSEFNFNDQRSLGQLRNKYNFTAVIVPDYYQENIDLMMDLMPQMEKFVFISDKAYVNKVAALHLQSLLMELYPDVKFSWIQGDEQNSQAMIDMFIEPQPKTGILVSSWVYEIETANGGRVPTTKDLVFLSESVNPVFTMRQLYMKMGALGGAFADNDKQVEHVRHVVEEMLRGQNMRQIPFYVPEHPIISVSYPLMQNYNLDVKKLPKGTVMVDKPQNVLRKYWLLVLVIFVALMTTIVVVLYLNKLQRKQIQVLRRHRDFINKLPMPYTKATLWLDVDNNVVNIFYESKNSSYEQLITNSSMPDNPLHLFSNNYLSDIAKKLLSTSEPVSVPHHFKRSGLYCYFIFVPLKQYDAQERKGKKKDGQFKKLDIDVFAIDITKDHEMQQQLKDQAVTIDISMEVAQLVPWQWDIASDTISFYTFSNYLTTPTTEIADGKLSSTVKFDEFIAFLPQADAEGMMKMYNKVLRGEVARFDQEFRLYRSPEHDHFEWCENHGVVTDTDSDGKPLRVTGSLQFITNRKLQEEKMSEALTKAQESDMLKSAFLANMSHEIRTPLNAIVGFSNLLATSEDMEERAEFANIINRNNEMLLSLINDILDLAKIESNTITLTYDLCDIHDVVDSISKTVSIRVPKGVKLNVAHYADSCVVRADASHVSQILINLLTNATKFTKRGSITVGYEMFEDEDKLYFYVKDTGIGIKKENLEKVFNRFVKLNNFVQGSGLGLAICRTLVEKMGGEIGVESPGEGRGSTFWFTIPYDPMELKIEDKDVVREALPEHIIGEHAEHPAKIESEKKFQFKGASTISQNALSSIPDGLKVLVAEDNPSNYWLISRLMQDKFELHHAENGRIAVEMYQQVRPDIIVMDINMPDLDGYGAVEEIRKLGAQEPIIAVTAYAFASDRVRILSSGFDTFVSKPVSASLLYEAILEAWERRKLKTANSEESAEPDKAGDEQGNEE